MLTIEECGRAVNRAETPILHSHAGRRRRTVSRGKRVVIEAKLAVPPIADDAVARPRVTALIAQLVERHPIVWVCATAGAGKTTAVAQTARILGHELAWLTLDETDAAPGRLLTYLEAAIARRVPEAAGVATGALAARIPQPEAAGLLAEAVGDMPLLVVLDGLERLSHADAEESRSVLGAFVRYAPPTTRVVLVSRVELSIDAPGAAGMGRVAAVGEADLAFTPSEAAEMLTRAGNPCIDPGRAVEVTGGWVTGILFEAWRSSDHVVGSGGEADPLHGYLASEILGRLEPEERRFLLQTSLLDEVTAERAEALGLDAAGDTLVGLRAKHLPVSWLPGGRAMRCHPRFREYLAERLERRGTAEVCAVRRAYGGLLMSERLFEEATEQFLRIAALDEAVLAADAAIEGVVARLDFRVAERWLDALRPVAPASAKRLTAAELMLAIGREDFARAGAIVDRLAADGQREAVARDSSMTASMMAWCYWHLGRIEDAREAIGVAPPSPEIDALRYLLTLVRHELSAAEPYTPVLSGGPLDALVMRVHYAHGRLPEVADTPTSSWAAAVSAPWRIGALRAMGQLEEALDLYRTTPAGQWSQAWMHGIVGAELMIDLGLPDEARDELVRGRALIRESGSLVFDMLNRLIEAKLELRLGNDPQAALRILDALEEGAAPRRYDFIGELLDTWRGLAVLKSAPDGDPVEMLQRAVESMTSANRILELPTAAVLLAEAQWRRGAEEAADRAADVALDAARRQGSNHHLLQALADFPSVLARRLDAEPRADSPWHEIGRALMARGVACPARHATTVHVGEFGRVAIMVDGREVRPRIAKSGALLAYLTSATNNAADRDELLEALFDGRSDDSARAYLRQAAHRLRETLPGIGPSFRSTHLEFEGPVVLRSESMEFESLIAGAARLQGPERFAVLMRALDIVGRGEYLPGHDLNWVNERRAHLANMAADAALDAAQIAFAAGDYRDAERLVETVLDDDPYKESAWRLLMRIANATGDEDRVIGSYRRCQQALGRLNAAPSGSTQQLLDQLRR